MRGTSVLLGKNYRPKHLFTDKEHEVQFKTRTPMKVGNAVSGRAGRSSNANCIQEMFNLMACLKNNEFEQAECSKELRIFNECSGTQRSVEFRKVSRQDKKKLNAQPGKTDLSTMQLNNFLKKFPT